MRVRHLNYTPSGRPTRGLSIRARLMLLALLAVAPLTVDRVRLLENSRAERMALAREDVVDLTRRAADAQSELISSTRAVLQVVARVYVTMIQGGDGCAVSLARFAADVPWIKGFSVVGPDDRVICSSQSEMIGRDLSDRAFVKAARTSRDFVLSDYVVDRADGEPVVIAAYPSPGPDPSRQAILLAPIDLRWISRLSEVVERRPGAAAALLDGHGTVVAAAPGQERLAGRSYAGHALVQEARSQVDGVLTADWFDGRRRLISYARLPGTDSRVVVGLDEREILSRIDREIGIAYLQLGLFGLLILLAAWFGGEQLIVEPIRALARVATRIGRGELDARPTEQKWATEFVPLVAALADMGHWLSERERELRSVNHHLEELASIDSLSGLANRRSFDARLDAEWRRAREARTPIALLMIDVDHFKLFNDNYGHVEGDRCLQLIGYLMNSALGGVRQIADRHLAARYGGEEFTMLMPDSDLGRAMEVAEQLRAAVVELRVVHHAAPCGYVTVSIGVAALVPADGELPLGLIEAADAGLYQAKRDGRNRVQAEAPALVPEAGRGGPKRPRTKACADGVDPGAAMMS